MQIDIYSAAADSFKLLSDTTRLRIFHYLCHREASVQSIAEEIGMSSPAVSHHLKLLKDAGLLNSRRSGKDALYTVAGSCNANVIRDAIDSLLKCSGCTCNMNCAGR